MTMPSFGCFLSFLECRSRAYSSFNLLASLRVKWKTTARLKYAVEQVSVTKMSETSEQTQLDELLRRLNGGDLLAAEEVFVKFAPYLRMIVRRQISGRLHAKFDSSDIVQSIWADLLVGFRKGRWHFSDAGHLQAFLVKATQNRFLDRVRRQRPVLGHERGSDASRPRHTDTDDSATCQPRSSDR